MVTAIWVIGMAMVGGGCFIAVELGKRRKRLIPLGIAIALIGAPLGLCFKFGAYQVITIQDSSGTVVAVRSIEIGSPLRALGDKNTLVINRSSRPVAIRELDYVREGENMLAAPRTWEIAAGARLEFGHTIDYLGPSATPAQTVQAEGSRVTRYWLIW